MWGWNVLLLSLPVPHLAFNQPKQRMMLRHRYIAAGAMASRVPDSQFAFQMSPLVKQLRASSAFRIKVLRMDSPQAHDSILL